MVEIVIVLGFGLLVAAASMLFAGKKLKGEWNNGVCIVHPQENGPCSKAVDDKTLKEINADFLERRNEFWCSLCQTLIIVVVVTILAVLLILEKISSEAALPVISGLGSFALGKCIVSAKNKITFDGQPDTKPAHKE
jgi:hypothetical protein